MVAITLVFEGIDDAKRHRDDFKTNRRKVNKVVDGQVVECAWANLEEGDLVLLKNREQVPTDCVIVQTSVGFGRVYVETSSVDGETNLKIRQSAFQGDIVKAGGDGYEWMQGGVLKAEAPSSLMTFSGSFTSKDGQVYGLDFNNFLLRGSEVRNVAWCLGVCTYLGKETKLLLSTRPAPSKFGKVELIANRIVYWAFFQLAIITVLCVVWLLWFTPNAKDMWYLGGIDTLDIYVLPTWMSLGITYFLLLGNVVPIALYVSMEIVSFCNAAYVGWDIEMECEVRTGNLVPELGQVTHLFSDKTGTLTQNRMTMAAIYSASSGVVYKGSSLRKCDQEKSLMDVLVLAHSVVVDQDDQGQDRFNAESPDEEAILKFHKVVCPRQALSKTEGGQYVLKDKSTYDIVAVNSFTSARKRMSILLKDVQGGYTLYLKGADDVMFARMDKDHANCKQIVKDFATHGLRTLVLASKRVSAQEYADWKEEYEHAVHISDTNEKEIQIQSCFAKLEQGLTLVGCTGIEDELQEDVGETVAKIRRAGIKFFVLTGDKMETTINIAQTAEILAKEAKLACFVDVDTVQTELLNAFKPRKRSRHRNNLTCTPLDFDALLVSGATLEQLLAKQRGNEQTEKAFIQACFQCTTVIVCRASPVQKALVVEAVVKQERWAITLAIGDGANDVPMIQASHVSVGIGGNEGLQARNSSDMAISKFSSLQRLLFVHGRWNYRRVASLVMFVCHSVQVFNWLLFFFLFDSMMSGSQVYTNVLYVTVGPYMYNIVCSIVATQWKDVEANTALKYPELYRASATNQDMTTKKIWTMMIRALLHSVAIYYIVVYATVSLVVGLSTLLNIECLLCFS